MKRLIMEAIGSFFLVFAMCLTGQPLAIGLIFAAMIYIGGHISGGHYNPAITLSFWLCGKLETCRLLCYTLAQTLGAFSAAALFNLIFNNTFFPAPLEHIHVWEAITIEALFTFVLCMVVLTVMMAHHLKANAIYGLAIGLTLTALLLSGGEISGGAFNPAVGLGPILYDTLLGGTSWHHLVIYLVGPSIGSIVAAYTYKYINQ